MVDRQVINTIIAEAGGNDPKAMAAVAAVINNRAQQLGLTPEQVVKQPHQFEGYSNPGRASRAAQQMSSVRTKAEKAWNGITNGTIADPTNGGTMFHAASITPYWADSANKNGTVKINGQIYYKGNQPSTAVAAINAAAPDAAPNLPDLSAYANPAFANVPAPPLPIPRPTNPEGIRSVEVNPDGTLKQSLTDALRARYSSVAPSADAASSYGGILPPALQNAAPLLPPTPPSVPSTSMDQSVGGPDQFIPASIRAMGTSIFGDRSQLSQKDFSQPELAVLERAAQNAENAGRSYIKYDDYQPGFVPIKGDPLNDSRLVGSVQNTIGRANFTRDKNGDLVITDKYDFGNNSESGGNPLYDAAHNLGASILPSGSGRDVNIRITPKAVSPDFSRGALGQQMRSAAPPVPQGLTSRPVQSIRIAPGDPLMGYAPPSLQDALNAKAAQMAQQRTIAPPGILTANGSAGVGASRNALVPSFAPQPNSGAIKTIGQAGQVALPPGVVPASVTRDLVSIAAQQMNRSGSPDDRQQTVPQIAPVPLPGRPVSLNAPYIPGPNGYTAANKDTSSLLPSAPLSFGSSVNDLPQVQAISQATSKPTTTYTYKQMQVSNPAYEKYIAAQGADDIGTGPGSFASLQSSLASVAPPKTISRTVAVPHVPVPSPTLRSLTSFNTVNPSSQIVPNIQSGFRSTPIGHIGSLLAGEPVQGGLLGMLLGGGTPLAGLFGGGGVPQVPSPAVGANFLNDRGVNTQGLTIGQQANELNKQLAGGSRNPDGSRGFM